MLSRMTLPDYPVAMGVIRASKSSVYEHELDGQIQAAKESSKTQGVDELLHSGHVFEIK
jgi:2-oxoglutarate ferredoxin oxidoreductase subunit beta